MTLYLSVPFPPTVNQYRAAVIVKGNPRLITTKKGRQYREHLIQTLFSQRANARRFEGRLRVKIDMYPPDRRKRDLDNYIKPILDGITAAGIWDDDSQIDELKVVRAEPVRGGVVRLKITDMG